MNSALAVDRPCVINFIAQIIQRSFGPLFPLLHAFPPSFCRTVFCNFHRRLAHQHTHCPLDANARQHRHSIQSNHSDQIKLNTSRNHSLQSIFAVLCCRFIALFLNRSVLLLPPFFNESLVFHANAVQCRQATPTPSSTQHTFRKVVFRTEQK